MIFPYCRTSMIYCIQFLQLTVYFDLYMTLKHISNYKSLLQPKKRKSFQLHFLPNGHSTTTFTWGGPNFILVSCTVLKLMSNWSFLDTLSVGSHNSEWPNRHFLTPFVRPGHIFICVCVWAPSFSLAKEQNKNHLFGSTSCEEHICNSNTLPCRARDCFHCIERAGIISAILKRWKNVFLPPSSNILGLFFFSLLSLSWSLSIFWVGCGNLAMPNPGVYNLIL